MSLAKKKREDEKIATILPAHIAENGRIISITVMVRRVSEEDLQIDLEKTQLRISTSKQNVKTRIIAVPEGSRLHKKIFHNGILELVLERP